MEEGNKCLKGLKAEVKWQKGGGGKGDGGERSGIPLD